MELSQAISDEGFQFYGYGQVLPEKAVGLPSPDQFCAAYALNGDIRGAVLLFVAPADAEGNESLYLEMGNILASRLADRLAATQQLDLLISPPRILKNESLSLMMKRLSLEDGERIGYRYFTEHREVPMQLIVFVDWQTAPSEGAAHA